MDLIPADREPCTYQLRAARKHAARQPSSGRLHRGRDRPPPGVTYPCARPCLDGEADADLPRLNAEALHAAISTSQLVDPEAGYVCVVEDPEACATEIRRL